MRYPARLARWVFAAAAVLLLLAVALTTQGAHAVLVSSFGAVLPTACHSSPAANRDRPAERWRRFIGRLLEAGWRDGASAPRESLALVALQAAADGGAVGAGANPHSHAQQRPLPRKSSGWWRWWLAHGRPRTLGHGSRNACRCVRLWRSTSARCGCWRKVAGASRRSARRLRRRAETSAREGLSCCEW